MKFEIEIEPKTNSAKMKSFGEKIAEGMVKTLDRLGIGNVGIGKAVSGQSDVKGGAVAGLAAGAVVGGLDMIINILKDIPIITAIMKLFGALINILFLPLVPILKPVLLLLGLLCKVLLKWMISMGIIGKKKESKGDLITDKASDMLTPVAEELKKNVGSGFGWLLNVGQ